MTETVDRLVDTSDVLSRYHTFEPPPDDFSPHEAHPAHLRRHGFPRRPDAEAEARLHELWQRTFARPMNVTRAELAIDPVMSRRNPLVRVSDDDFRPLGWGGIVVPTSSVAPGQRANTVFAQWTIPGIFPATDPNGPITTGFWVGLDGFYNDQVLQAGVAVTVSPDPNNLVQWWAWTEWYTSVHKDPAVAITNFPVNVGDTVSFLVCAPQTNHGFIAVNNLTTRQSTSVGIDAPSGYASLGTSAEWIVEGISEDFPVFLPSNTFTQCSAGTQGTSIDLSHGITTEVTGTNGNLTKSTIASPTVGVVQWEGWT